MDRRALWHPFTQMSEWEAEEPVIIETGRDCFIRDTEGRWYLDAVSSLWVNVHGHRKAALDAALKAQVDRIAHTTTLGLGNVPSIELATRLVGLMERSFGPFGRPVPRRVFYSDNGSTAVEVGLKMAFQYWLHKGEPARQRFVSLNNAYHGDTIGAMSVGGIALFHGAFGPLFFAGLRAPSPSCHHCELGLRQASCAMACLARLDGILSSDPGGIAGVIVEPLVQAAGGMLMSPPGYLKGVRDLCTRHGTLLIADEVATGFGRTGRMFACEHEGVTPDIICLSKGLTGGYLPLAATIATEEIYSAFLGEYREFKTFFHGHSYTGNPLGCATALACLDVFDHEQTLQAMAPKVDLFERWMDAMSAHPHVGDARSRGLMGGVELVANKATGREYPMEEKMGWRVAYAARRRGVGLTLAADALSFAGMRGCKTADLEVRESNEAAIRLYERLGFRRAGKRRGYYDDPPEDAVLMRLEGFGRISEKTP